MTTNLKTKPPYWFWAVSVIALLWNLMGVAAYLGDAFMTAEDLAQLSPDMQSLYESRPAWVTGAYAIAVWSGTLGCIALLLRKKWAITLLILSLIGVLAQNVYQFFMSDTFEVLGTEAVYLPIVIILVTIMLVMFARTSANKNWIV
ncbi:hypothetical protein [Pareuzebyella sediminis]|uniref:hypothetical protein n=1 Tax=Pareuzebyella sediminis TaxID=2607998 RepID=UPI0011EFF8B7|nr:hypothetical protein [Pareuzebyella sediminis]